MASSYSTDLKLELMTTGENAGTWGDNTNNNLNLIQQAIAGYEAVALSDGGTVALAMTDKTISNARNMVIKFTGTLTSASTVTIPNSIEKFYIFDCSAVVGPTNLTIKTASGTGFTLDRAAIYAAYADGTNLNEISLDTLGGTIGTAQIADDAVTLAKMASGTAGNIISYDASGNPVAVATGTCGQVLTSAGPGAPPTFADVASGGAASWNTTVKTGDFTAVNGEGYFVDTTSGEIDVTLPAGSPGAVVAVKDYANTWDTNNCILIPNGSEKIGGVAGNATIATEGLAVTLVYIDSTQGWLVTDDGLQSRIQEAAAYVVATGGTVVTSGDFKSHIFTGPGTFTVSCAGNPAGSNTVDYLVVAGGGSAGGYYAGGGAGGFRISNGDSQPAPTMSPLSNPTGLPVTATGYPVTVGGGGTGGPGFPGIGGYNGNQGSSSVFSTITSAGGGFGASGGPTVVGGSGGSGGASGYFRPACGQGQGNTPPVSPPQGNPAGRASYANAGGGGGAGAAGSDGTINGVWNVSPVPGPNVGGPGGIGSYIADSTIGPTAPSYGEPGPVSSVRYFAGGGGGGVCQGQPGPSGTGGAGGGGDGKPNSGPFTSAQNGVVNTGGGGGSSGGGLGGSGIVIIRYKYQ